MAGVATPPTEHTLHGNNNGWAAQEEQQNNGNNDESQPFTNGNSSGIAGDDSLPGQDPENPEYPPRRGSSVGNMSASGNNSKGDSYRGEKEVKPNKVYIGGLPEHTRQEDLQNCFGKIGKIVNIELKVGYGFVEFENKDSAEESVQKYHEGFFMGQKIRVELSHGGGRTAKYSGDPGACFRCGQVGHWARECPSASGSTTSGGSRRAEGALIDRIQRDYTPRAAPPRDDYAPRYPPRDPRYEYPPAAPPRDYRRPPSPSPREYRDYPPPPPRGRDYDDYRRGPPPPVHDRDRYPPPPPAPDYARGRYGAPPPPPDAYRGYPPGPPPVPGPYDRYDRRPAERYPPAGYPPPPPPPGRGRTPPLRDYDRPPTTRDYPDYRGRPASPPRYPPGDFPRASAEPPTGRYRRRSLSPVPTRSPAPYDAYNGNGYSGNVQGPPRRDYPGALPPHPRSGRDMEPAPYRRP